MKPGITVCIFLFSILILWGLTACQAADSPAASQPSIASSADNASNKTVQSNPKDKPLKADLLKGKIVCIDAGHGRSNKVFKPEPIAPGSKEMKSGTDSGTSGIATGIPEYKLNLAVSAKLQSKLLEYGATVVMVRENNSTDFSNVERAEIANSAKSDLFVRIHADGSENSKVHGTSVLYPGPKYIKDQAMLQNSKRAAGFVLQSMVSATGASSRGIVERNDLTGFNWAKVPSILVEMGFMTNTEEDKRMNTAEYQNKIANGIVNGILKYFGK